MAKISNTSADNTNNGRNWSDPTSITADAVYFFCEGTSGIDAIEIVVEARVSDGTSSIVPFALPNDSYTCRGEFSSSPCTS